MVLVAALAVVGLTAAAAAGSSGPAVPHSGYGWVPDSASQVRRDPLPVSAGPQLVQKGAAGWASSSYLQAHPDFLARVLGKPVTATPDTVAAPASHFGCNQQVCIDVEGVGEVVTFWGTTADGGNYSCWRPYFQVWTLNSHSGKEVHNWPGPVICAGAGDGVFYDNSNEHAGGYPNKYSLCNVWAYISGTDHIAGYPCANIEA